MLSVNTFFRKTSYKEIVASLVDAMSANFKDFAEDQARFNKTISLIKNTETMDAIEQQIGSVLLFSCYLGLKANLDHFIDRIGRTFLDVDPEIYLREAVARRLSDYQNGQCVQERFYSTLSPAQQDRYEDIATYISHLETVGPKLAHFYGYMLGNQLFPHIIPGYGEDTQLTLRYRHMLEDYLGIKLQ